MNINETIFGFKLSEIRRIEELKCNMYIMRYEKNGAKLIYLDRKDDNMTFAVSFKTVPEDDTGIFHILEHSVLNGSEKFPVKEPFVELLKSSVNTYLNALTFSDKTLYPVSSRNKKDFLNLIDVYMDAVMHPLIYKKPEIFMQEGWHFEFKEDGEAFYNGVVYNEMKGAYGSVNTVISNELSKLLFPNNCYGKESGGHPESIPSLTYKKFLEGHKKFYHPSNSIIFLDGQIDLDEILRLLDSYLCEYKAQNLNFEIVKQKPVSPEVKEVYYESSESSGAKAQYAIGYVLGDYSDKTGNFAASILSDYLCGSNESPLKKQILSLGLAEDVYFSEGDGELQTCYRLIFRNTSKESIPQINAVLNEVLGELACGTDKKQLTACLNQFEFRLREKDFGSFPRGLVYCINCLETMLYGGDPAQNLVFEDALKVLKQGLSCDFYEKKLREFFIDNPHTARVILIPDSDLAVKKSKKTAAEIKNRLNEMGKEKTSELKDLAKNLKKIQMTPDSPEALSKIPSLELSDIKKEPRLFPVKVENIAGITALTHDIDTSGIIYLDLYFNINDLSAEELSLVSLAGMLFGLTATKNHSALETENEIKTHLGSLRMYTDVYPVFGDNTRSNRYAVISASALDSKKDKLLGLVSELSLNSLFNDRELILNYLKQIRISFEQGFTTNGTSFAIKRVTSFTSSAGAALEYFSGYEFYLWAKKLENALLSGDERVFEKLSSILKRIFTKERLTISVNGINDEGLIRSALSIFPSDGIFPKTSDILPFSPSKEGLIVPSSICFSAKGVNLFNIGENYSGALKVASSIISLDYLWREVRVKGGAYGTWLSARASGSLIFYSFRDPDAKNSLLAFSKTPEYIEEFSKSDADLSKYIIGAVGSTEVLTSPRTEGSIADSRYFSGMSDELLFKTRSEMLSLDKEKLLSLKELFKKADENASVCVIGSKEIINSIKDELISIKEAF